MTTAKQHPEQGETEVFLCNDDLENIGDFSWRSLRVGNIAYNDDDKELKGLYPLFVSKKEWDEHQSTISSKK